MKFFLVVSLFTLCSANVSTAHTDKPDWLKLDELNEKIRSAPKPVIMDIYTSWCYWCKVMDKKTYTNSKVVSYINAHFYPVRLDAETKQVVRWNSKDYSFNENYKVNDFTMYVTSGQPGYPTTVIFPDENSAPVSIQGFLEPKEIEPILKYFGEGAYKKQSFEDFKSGFTSTW